MLDALPLDVLYKIFVHLAVDDLVRLQQVSKTFFDITQHRAVWSDAYESSVLPRPPGPFAWQSSSYLRSTLVTSAKVDRNWPPHEASRFSSRDIVLSRTEYRFSLVFGRWFFAASSSTVRCFDLDSEDGSGQRVHGVRRDDGATIASFWCAGIAVPDGPLAFSACIEATRTSTSEVDYVIKVFKLIFLEGSTVKFELVQEIPTGLQNLDYIDLTPQGLIIQARGPVADRHSHLWIMDIRTYRLYKLSTPPLDGRRSWHIAKVCLGTTHLFLFHSPPVPSLLWRSYVEAFPLHPEADGELHLSHRSDCAHIVPIKTWRAHQSDRITLLAVENKRCVLARFTLAPSLNAEEKGPAPISFDTQAISAFPPVLKRGTDLRLQSVSASGNRRVLVRNLDAFDDGDSAPEPRMMGLTLTMDGESVSAAGTGDGLGDFAFVTENTPVMEEDERGVVFFRKVMGFDEAKGRVCVQKWAESGLVMKVIDFA